MLVMLKSDENGLIKEDEKRWCIQANLFGDYATLCGDMIGVSASSGAGVVLKEKDKGEPTCSHCLAILEVCKEHIKLNSKNSDQQ